MSLQDAVNDTVYKKLPGNAAPCCCASVSVSACAFVVTASLSVRRLTIENMSLRVLNIIILLFFVLMSSVGSGGLIAINALGEYSMEFNSKGMFRGVCESSGECSVGIWEEMVPFRVGDAAVLSAPSIVTGSETAEVEEKRSIPL